MFSRFEGLVQEVDAETAAGMLTHPGDEFEVDEREPLLRLPGVDANMVGLLAFEGFGCVSEVAALSGTKARRLAKAVGVTRKVAQVWVEEAREMISEGTAEAQLVELGLVKRGCCG